MFRLLARMAKADDNDKGISRLSNVSGRISAGPTEENGVLGFVAFATIR